MDIEKDIDERWKNEAFGTEEPSCHDGCGCGHEHGHDHVEEEIEVNFFNYIASMGYQAMIFLGEVPNPMTQDVTQSPRQAKFLIDTMAMVRDKTRGNLNPQEDQFINATVSELEMKYAQLSGKGKII
jgi:hypothetical protein